MVIAIISYFDLLLCHESIRDKSHRVLAAEHCFVAHFLCFKLIPHIYLWLSHKPVGYIYQGGRVVPHCGITHLCFEMVRDIAQVQWICLSCFKTHFLCFKTGRNMVKCSRHGTHYPVAGLPRFKMLWDKKRHTWSVAHCLLTRLLRFKTVRDIRQCLVAHFLPLKTIGDHFYPFGHIYLYL